LVSHFCGSHEVLLLLLLLLLFEAEYTETGMIIIPCGQYRQTVIQQNGIETLHQNWLLLEMSRRSWYVMIKMIDWIGLVLIELGWIELDLIGFYFISFDLIW